LGAGNLNPVHDPGTGRCCIAIPQPRHDIHVTP
jgi:hypothetical protein